LATDVTSRPTAGVVLLRVGDLEVRLTPERAVALAMGLYEAGQSAAEWVVAWGTKGVDDGE